MCNNSYDILCMCVRVHLVYVCQSWRQNVFNAAQCVKVSKPNLAAVPLTGK